MRTTPLFLTALLLVACGSDYTEGVSRAEVDEAPSEAAEAPRTETTETAEPEADTPPEADEREVLTLDAARSSLGYTGAKLTGSHDGQFPDFTGEIRLDAAELTGSSVSIEIDMRTLQADDPRLTNHLRSDDFFDVARFPTATFSSSRLAPAEGEDVTHTVTGTLEMHGQSREVSFPANIEVSDGEVRARAQFIIDRTTWGVSYPGRAEDLIRNDVVIRFDVRANRAPRS